MTAIADATGNAMKDADANRPDRFPRRRQDRQGLLMKTADVNETIMDPDRDGYSRPLCPFPWYTIKKNSIGTPSITGYP